MLFVLLPTYRLIPLVVRVVADRRHGRVTAGWRSLITDRCRHPAGKQSPVISSLRARQDALMHRMFSLPLRFRGFVLGAHPATELRVTLKKTKNICSRVM